MSASMIAREDEVLGSTQLAGRYEAFAWFVGLFEGEGSIVLYRQQRGPNHGLRLVIGMVDEDVIRRAAAIAECGVVKRKFSPSMEARGQQPQWMWIAEARGDVVPLLRQMLPHLGERRAAKARASMKAVEQEEATRG